jgi:hypothetical protein
MLGSYIDRGRQVAITFLFKFIFKRKWDGME